MKKIVILLVLPLVSSIVFAADLTEKHATAIVDLLNSQEDGTLVFYRPATPVSIEVNPFFVKKSIPLQSWWDFKLDLIYRYPKKS